MTSPTAALAALRAEGDPAKAAEMARYHKTTREVFGVANPIIDALAKDWRAACESPSDRVALADALWRSEAFEACIAAAKLLTQARIPDDGPVWDLIAAWVPEFDGWAIADHACSAAARRLSAVPDRLDDVEPWTQATSMWTRRAALVATLPWAKLTHPTPADAARRARIQGRAARNVSDREGLHQKAVGWWLRTLSKHDPEAVRAFLASHGDAMKPFAVREASKHLC